MAICTNVKNFGNLVEDFITQYEEMLKDDTLSDVESSDTQEALDKLYNYRRAVKNNDLDYIRAQSFVTFQDDMRQEVMQDSFKAVLGETFGFTYGASKKVRQGILLSVKPIDGGVSVKFVENGTPKVYTFPNSSNGRSHNSKKGSSHINVPGFRKFLDNYTLSLDAREKSELILGSEDSKMKLDDEYKHKDYIHGSVAHMKEILQKLHLLGGSKAKQEELDTYMSYLDKMTPEFFNSLELYIKEDADKSEGVARARRIDIAVDGRPASIGNQQSEASIYMEEVIHSMTSSAINANTPEARNLKRQLTKFTETARKQITWQDFLPETSIDAAKEEAYAKWLYRYMFVDDNAEFEFIAKAITVPEVAAAFKKIKVKGDKENKRFLDRVNEFFALILDVIQGTIKLKQKDDNVHDALVNLAFNFGEINNRANRNATEKGNYLTKVFDIFNGIDDKTAFLAEIAKDKVLGKVSGEDVQEIPTDLYGRIKFVGRFIALSIVNPNYRKAMASIAGAYVGLGPTSTVREVIGGMFATDSAQKVAEFLGMQSGYIDKLRNNQIDTTMASVLSEFDPDTEVTKEVEEALTAVIADTDLNSLFGKNSAAKGTSYDNKTIRTLLTSDEEVDNLIKKVRKSLKDLDETHYHWHVNQATGLGIYMAEHRGTPEQNLNATNIARGIHSSHRKKPLKKVVAAVDELATLEAIKRTNKDQRSRIADLMKEDQKGVQHVADVLEGFKKNSEQEVFKGRTTNQIKGYTREVFDDSIIMEIAPAADKEKMEAQGFTFRGKLGNRAGDKRDKEMALYVTDIATRPDRLRGATRLQQITSKGTTITAASFKDGEGFDNNVIRERARRDINNIEKEALKRAKAMEEPGYSFDDTVFGVVPVINDNGKVTDYRYMMDKATKKQLLKQDTRITEVVGRSFGTVLDKSMSAEHNKLVLSAIKEDMLANWTSGDKGNDGLTDFTQIGPNVSDPEMRKLYYMMPREFQEFVNNRNDKTLAVRSDLLFLYFGYSNLSISDFPGLKKITPQILIKVLNFAEMLWMEVVKIAKSNILLKMPTILLSNIFSNVLYAVMRGYDPITVTRLYIESYRDISQYNNDVKKQQELLNKDRQLKVSIAREILSESRKKELSLELLRAEGELKAVKKRIEKSPIHELVQLGMDQNVEDTTNNTDRDTNRITSFIEDRLEAAPELVRDGLDILFITRRTKFYKVANEFLEVSDLVARDVQNRLEKKNEQRQADGGRMLPDWWLSQQDSGYNPKQRLTGEERKVFLEQAKQQRQYDLVEDFINYTKPSSRFEEYLNKIGILMFTKYVKRIQRIIIKSGSRGPLKAAVGAFGFAYLGGLPSIHEQSFLVKDWYGDSLGPGNVFPIYAPTETFMNFITPGLLKDSTYDISL